MTVLYSNDFEAETVSSGLAAFTALLGSNFVVLSTPTPARGSKGFGRNSHGDSAYWNGNTSIANTGVRSAQKLNSGLGSFVNHLHRVGAGTDVYIIFKLAVSAGNMRISAEVRNNASMGLADSGYSLAVVAGDVLHCETLSIGNVHEGRIWVNNQSRPGAATVTLTNSALASGSAGVMKLGTFENTSTDDLVITDGAGGEDFFYPALPTISVQPANQSATAPATAVFSVTASGATSYQWQRSTNSGGAWANVSTGTGGTTASYTTGATTVTGGGANNADQYRVNVINAGGTVTSSAAILTVSAAVATATTLTGPSGGTVGAASAAFTVGANGTITGTVTVTPSDGGGGGAFSPTSVAISSGTPTATFTYTPGSIGAKTISISDTGSLTDATPLTYTATLTSGTLTSSPLKNNTGTLLTSAACEAFVSNATTGALVVKVTGLTSHATTGVVTFADGAVVAATAYRVVWRMTSGGAEGLETLTAT